MDCCLDLFRAEHPESSDPATATGLFPKKAPAKVSGTIAQANPAACCEREQGSESSGLSFLSFLEVVCSSGTPGSKAGGVQSIPFTLVCLCPDVLNLAGPRLPTERPTLLHNRNLMILSRRPSGAMGAKSVGCYSPANLEKL